MRKPRLFIGSASETLGIVDALEEVLHDAATIDRWDRDTFRPGAFTLEELTDATRRYDFAVFILGRDDVVESRGRAVPSPRDNVVFEAGLFTAALGRQRVFYVVDAQGTKLPSDWAGLGYLTFEGQLERACDRVFGAARKIRQQITAVASSGRDPRCGLGGHWWQYVEGKDSGSVLSLLEITVSPADAPRVRLKGNAWSVDGLRIARFRSRSAELDESSRTLFYSWEGEHPRDGGVPSFFGIGQIVFDELDPAPVSGVGWFSASKAAELAATETKSTRYARATPDEVERVERGEGEARAAVVRSKLLERETAAA